MFQHIWSIFEKKMIFPLEKLKILRIFPQFGPQTPLTPPWPLTKGKIFLCISGRIGPFYTLLKKCRKLTSLRPPPLMQNFLHFFFLTLHSSLIVIYYWVLIVGKWKLVTTVAPLSEWTMAMLSSFRNLLLMRSRNLASF